MSSRPSLTAALLPLALLGCAPKAAPPAPPSGPTAAESAAQMAACAYTPGLPASKTVPAGLPTGDAIPIKHIVLLMQENRSFDHYYSELNIPGLDVAPANASNPDANGNPVTRFHLTTQCMGGGNHSWDAEHHNLDNGKNDGFVTESGTTTMGYYTEADLPYYYALSRTFAISDAHFCSVLGPTWPNRMYFMAGTSFGIAVGTVEPPAYDAQGNSTKTLFSELDEAGVDWRDYSQDLPTVLIVPNTFEPDHLRPESQFATDVANGDLAAVTMVEASDLQGPLSPDEGPPGDVGIGQQFISNIIGTIMKSQFWDDTVIFLTYDENGGMWDHVVPPAACPPDDLAPIMNASTVAGGATTPGLFNQLGFRVPFIVISPYARRGYLSHVVTDHTSILRFVEAKFNLPAMTKRDANALPPYDMFDFDHPDFSIPDLPVATVDQDQLYQCEQH